MKKKCRSCNHTVTLRKNNILWKLDKVVDKNGKKEEMLHSYKIVEQKNGMFKLELIGEEKTPLSIRKKMAEHIVSEIAEKLKEQVPAMVTKALSIHEKDELEVIQKDIDKGKTPQLKSKPGCVFLQTSKGKVFL